MILTQKNKIYIMFFISILSGLLTLFICTFLYQKHILFYSEDLIIDSVPKVFCYAVFEGIFLDPIGWALIAYPISRFYSKCKDKQKTLTYLLLAGTTKKNLYIIWLILFVSVILASMRLGRISGFFGLFSILGIPVSVFYTTFFILVKRSNYTIDE